MAYFDSILSDYCPNVRRWSRVTKRRIRVGLLLATLAVAVWYFTLVRMPIEPDVNADRFVLFSIDGRDNDEAKVRKASERFQGYPVLGKVEVKDMTAREAVLAAFREGAPGQGTGPAAHCFWPRHAISTTRAGNSIDYVICFECAQYKTIRGDIKITRPISEAPLSKFNHILTQASVELAPSAFEPSK